MFFLKGVYSAEFHPKFVSGEWTEDQVLENWLGNFSKEAGNYQVFLLYLLVFIFITNRSQSPKPTLGITKTKLEIISGPPNHATLTTKTCSKITFKILFRSAKMTLSTTMSESVLQSMTISTLLK